MSQYKSIHGVILSQTEYKDSDAIYSVLTKEEGKISVYTRGIKKIQSRLRGIMRVGAVVSLDLVQKSQLPIVSGGKSIYLPEISDYSELCQLSYILEITKHLCQEQQEVPQIFQLLSQCIPSFCHSSKKKLFILAYTLQILSKLGFIAPLKNCTSCSQKLAVDKAYFIPEQGIVCESCEKYGETLDATILKTLCFLQSASWCDIEKLQADEAIIKKLQRIVQNLQQHYIHKKLKSDPYSL